jgi:uncharacterized FAD-dependent dehydrogenase
MGILEFHAAVVGQLQLKGDNELSASIMIGGGITIGVPFIKSSFYVQGNVEITGKIPSATKGAVEGLKWLLVQWADKQKENSAFGKLLKTLSSAHKAKGADKLKEVSTKIRQRLKSPDASEKKDGNSGSFDVEEYKFDKIIEDGHKKFIELTIAYKEKAAEMLAELKKKSRRKEDGGIHFGVRAYLERSVHERPDQRGRKVLEREAEVYQNRRHRVDHPTADVHVF